MRALTTTAVVHPNHTLTVQVPSDIAPGVRQVIVILEDPQEPSHGKPSLAEMPAHDVGLVDPSMTFRREDMYGDDGR